MFAAAPAAAEEEEEEKEEEGGSGWCGSPVAARRLGSGTLATVFPSSPFK